MGTERAPVMREPEGARMVRLASFDLWGGRFNGVEGIKPLAIHQKFDETRLHPDVKKEVLFAFEHEYHFPQTRSVVYELVCVVDHSVFKDDMPYVGSIFPLGESRHYYLRIVGWQA